MPDVVVTVPKHLWDEWLAEGDLPGDHRDENSEDFYCFNLSGTLPKIEVGERVYVVAHNRLRGYAPLVDMSWDGKLFGEPFRRRFALIRGGGAVAVTIPETVRGFRGWRYRFWDRSEEVPFPEWKSP